TNSARRGLSFQQSGAGMMLQRLNIRQRILLTFLAIVLTGGAVQLVIAGHQLQVATLTFHQHHLEIDAVTIAATLSEPMEHYLEGKGTREIQQTLALMQREKPYEYLIVDNNYRLVGFVANRGYEQLERAPLTPELEGAARGGIVEDVRVGHDGQMRLYIAAPVLYEGETLGFLVLSHLMQPAYDEIMHQWAQLSVTTLPVIGGTILASLWVSATISQPIEQLRNSAIKMAQGNLSARIEISAQDEVGQLGQTLNDMAEQIESLLQTQRSFVNNAAHELRTPLMTLKLRAEALEDEALAPEERTQYVREIQREVDHMVGLVSSLLALARIDEGRQHKRAGGITDTVAILHDIVRHWRVESARKGLDFVADIPPSLADLPLTADDLRLVMDNLLANALKYTPAGRVCFFVEQQAEWTIMRVCDTGIGFTPEQADQLFNRFYRSEQARASFDGHGLGLSIAQAVLQQYGARISAESAGIGRGATFTVMIPVG
ncbi:MAG: sensor histidine kinase, partial [Anaerolineae bacterium]